MADQYQINRTFQDLGGLFAAEHAEADDDGADQVHGLIKSLRKFKAHEDQERERKRQLIMGSPAIAALSEATYQLGDGRSVYYDDGKESLRDAADLYAVLPEDAPGGSPNLENLQARHLLDRVQRGMGLSESHIGTLRALMSKHAKKIASHRQNRAGQDPLQVASPGPESRMIPASERT